MENCPFAARMKVRQEDGQKCTWFPGTTEENPHPRCPRNKNIRDQIMPDILYNIGETPCVRINKIGKSAGLKCDLVAKCEFFNSGGSVKDRIARYMVESAAESGRLKPGDTIIEPTSGNTGIGLALAAAVRGYKCTIVLPEKMSAEKVNVMKALGAEIIRTPTEAASESPDSHISVAARLQAEMDNAHILDQYLNTSNPMAHYDGTAEEIWEQCGGKVDMLVAGAGTGGTISGIGRRLKELNPDIILVGCDPEGSILALPEEQNVTEITGYELEGIGYDFIPRVCDRGIVDRWFKTTDKPAFQMARRMIREEGLLCGGSSGCAMAVAIEAAKELREDQRCVVICPDSVRNYMTKFLSDAWMYEHGFIEENSHSEIRKNSWWGSRRVAELQLNAPITVSSSTTCADAINVMISQGFDMVPVQSVENGEVLGAVTEGNLTALITQGRLSPSETCGKAMYKKFKKVNLNTTLSDLAAMFDTDSFALVVAEQKCFNEGVETIRSVVTGVVTRIDLLNFIAAAEKK
jgi:cystathionine beta-synthase